MLIALCTLQAHALVIDRAIVASDANHDYLDFWPIVAKAWARLGIKPTLALIANNHVQVDESLGDVIRFDPIPGVSNALYAQTIRLLLPILFENEVCLISDIDMIPISQTYYQGSISTIANDKFVVYRDATPTQYKMCYNVAKGSIFQEIFGIKEKDEIPFLIKQWAERKMGWATDELLLYEYLHNWKDFNTRCVRLQHSESRRIDRANWRYDASRLKAGYYIDCHSLRPYEKFKTEIDALVSEFLG
jgi:hypothetical protein